MIFIVFSSFLKQACLKAKCIKYSIETNEQRNLVSGNPGDVAADHRVSAVEPKWRKGRILAASETTR